MTFPSDDTSLISSLNEWPENGRAENYNMSMGNVLMSLPVVDNVCQGWGGTEGTPVGV